MNVNIYYTEVYENKSNWTLGENEPKQTQFQIGRQKEKMERFSLFVRLLLKNYAKEPSTNIR